VTELVLNFAGREMSDEKKIYLEIWMVNFPCPTILTSVMAMIMNVHPVTFVYEDLENLGKKFSVHQYDSRHHTHRHQ